MRHGPWVMIAVPRRKGGRSAKDPWMGEMGSPGNQVVRRCTLQPLGVLWRNSRGLVPWSFAGRSLARSS